MIPIPPSSTVPGSHNVRDTYVAGQPLVKDKKLVKVDLKQVRKALKAEMDRTAFREMGRMV